MDNWYHITSCPDGVMYSYRLLVSKSVLNVDLKPKKYQIFLEYNEGDVDVSYKVEDR